MALWNEKPASPTAGPAAVPASPPPERHAPERVAAVDPSLAVSPRRPTPKTGVEGGESVIAANLHIEGKIEGSGNVRMASLVSTLGGGGSGAGRGGSGGVIGRACCISTSIGLTTRGLVAAGSRAATAIMSPWKTREATTGRRNNTPYVLDACVGRPVCRETGII